MTVVSLAILSAAALLIPPLSQDPSIQDRILDLRNDDPKIRERAMLQLQKTPLEQLPLFQPFLQDQDIEFKLRLQQAMSKSLAAFAGRRVNRFAVHAVAEREVMVNWTDHGPDLLHPPEGYVVLRNPLPDSVLHGSYLCWPEILIEKTVLLTGRQLVSVSVVEDTLIRSASVLRCQISESVSAPFDKAMRTLQTKDPPVMLALLVDGRLTELSSSEHQSVDGVLRLSTRYHSREEAEKFAGLIQGEWFELSLRVESEQPDPPSLEEVETLLKKVPGFSTATVASEAPGKWRIAGSVDVRDAGLLDLWLKARSARLRVLPAGR